MTVKTCTKCGEAKALAAFGVHRSTKDGLRHVCRACNNAAARKWGAENPEKARALARKWASNNPERRREIASQSYVRHSERYAEEKAAAYRADPVPTKKRAKLWTTQNRERVNASQRLNSRKPERRAYMYAYWNMRRASKMKATPAWLTAIQLAQTQEFYDVAVARTTQTGVVHHVDHIHPLKGANFRGLHVPWNLQVLTAFENTSKGNRLPDNVGGL